MNNQILTFNKKNGEDLITFPFGTELIITVKGSAGGNSISLENSDWQTVLGGQGGVVCFKHISSGLPISILTKDGAAMDAMVLEGDRLLAHAGGGGSSGARVGATGGRGGFFSTGDNLGYGRNGGTSDSRYASGGRGGTTFSYNREPGRDTSTGRTGGWGGMGYKDGKGGGASSANLATGGGGGGASYIYDKNSLIYLSNNETLNAAAYSEVIVEVLNSTPEISDTTQNNKTFYKGDIILLNGSITDVDSGNTVAIKYNINDGQAQTIKSSVSDGVTPIPYSKSLTYSNGKLKDGIAEIATGLIDGTTYNIKIWAEDDQGGKSTITTRNFTVVTNRPPTISGTDGNLGDKNATFNVNYMITDADGDAVTVTEKLNGTVIKTITNAPQNVDTTITISNETLYSLVLGQTNTIEIRAEDSKGGVSYRRYTFKRSNSAPKISGQDADLGVKTQEFNVTFSATDVEATSMSAKVFLNDTLKESYAIIDGQDYTYTMTRNDFLQLDTTQHNVRIEVTDADGGTAIRNFNFTKVATKLEHGIKIDTDAMSTQVLVTPTYHLAEGAALKVMVCNNVNDTIPSWEDATEQVLLGRHYNFLNVTKTDPLASWGVGIKISIEKGTATEKSYLSGYGGAYK